MLHLSAVLGLVCYVAAAALFILALLRRQPESPNGTRLVWAGFAAHSLLLLYVVMFLSGFQISNRGEAQVWVSWILALVFLASQPRLKTPVVGAFLIPAVTLFFVSSSVLSHGRIATPEPGHDRLLFIFHVIPMIFGEVVMVLALVASSCYLIQERRVRVKTIDALSIRGPSLDLLDTLARRLVLGGFLLMSVAVLSGSLWAVALGKSLYLGDPAQWFGFGAWALFGFVSYTRIGLRWSPRRRAVLTLSSVAVFLVILFLSFAITGSSIHFGAYGGHGS